MHHRPNLGHHDEPRVSDDAVTASANGLAVKVGAAALLSLVTAVPALAQPRQDASTEGNQSPAVTTTSGNVVITYGYTSQEVQKLTRAAVAGATGPLTDEIAELSGRLGVTQGALIAFLRSIGEQNLAPEQLPQTLAEVAERYKQLLARVAALDPQDPATKELVAKAQAAIQAGRLDEADGLLDQAKQMEITAAQKAREIEQQAQEAGDKRFLRAAQDSATQGDVALVRLRYPEAVRHFAEAAELVPAGHSDEIGRYLSRQADALVQQGDLFGDNGVLERAIATQHLVLEKWTRERVPLLWAGAQNDLGAALETLGVRQNSKVHLEEAVTAFRAALEVQTRERVPLLWAGTQNNLGNALQALGARESDTIHLEEAVTAIRAALNEWPRERVPRFWAGAQNNLGNALYALGIRESSKARLEEAVTAFRAALEERPRERMPLDWAVTQRNLGNALEALGVRENGTMQLKEAVTAYRASSEEETRERAPAAWAMTQSDLGNALTALGEREEDTAQLKQAVAAFQAALQEQTRERAPLDWAMTQNNLGNALSALGRRETDTASLKGAVIAYQAALEVQTRALVPHDWAATQNNLGNALSSMGERENNTMLLVEALTAFRAALEERTRKQAPFEWATTENNLGDAFLALGARESGTGRLEEAVTAYDACLEVTAAVWPRQWVDEVQHHRQQALGEIRRRYALMLMPNRSSHP